MTKRPRKALAETNPNTLDNKPIPEDIDAVPTKKNKKASTTSKAKEPKASAANPPAFLTEVTLPGEEDVQPPAYILQN